MKYLRLFPSIHKHQAIVKDDFDFDRELIALVKAKKGTCWSQSLCLWYFPKKEFDYNQHGEQFYNDLAWEGLQDTVAWNNLSESEKNRIRDSIQSHKSTGEKDCN